MKKIAFLLSFIFWDIGMTFAQDAVYKNDTLIYKNIKIYPLQKIQLLYGAKPDKSFVFVSGSKSMNDPLPAILSKQKGGILKIIKQHSKYYAVGYVSDAPAYLGKEIVIDIEGAIDCNEIKIESK
ncbi:hypothetical protein SAMN05192574_103344 [Mucilaginibacter gossypiicola]|uniref:Uncharacterized protein n=1 Tax=Mucilaginibacter gossypiicola TaxID=551995 RepID=A0A1H8H0I2_9SPHI|nr:hypothetical protein [Mucilaginibacter gossypiicola]SEN49743.1 hypothetical protein SAMN05192574_103344 [Mucilaginibacter gossypiicola]